MSIVKQIKEFTKLFTDFKKNKAGPDEVTWKAFELRELIEHLKTFSEKYQL